MNKDNRRKTIGILTLPFTPNYGWLLQMWALYSFLNKEGFDARILDRHWNDSSPSALKRIMRWVYYHTFNWHFNEFMKRRLRKSPVLSTSEELSRYVSDSGFYAIVVGSDQVWRIENTRETDLNYFLDFLNDENIIRVAYSASFGTDKWAGTAQETLTVTNLLSKFKQISLREQSGVELCEQVFHQKAHWTLDPTLLLEADDYYQLFSKIKPTSKPYVASYFLDSSTWKDEMAKRCCQQYDAKLLTLYPSNPTLYTFYKSVEQWLGDFYYADFVIVDSYHGMLFSIIFKKQFMVIANEHRGLTRFTSLLSSIGLMDRLFFEKDGVYPTVPAEEIDYDNVYRKLEKLRSSSRALLLQPLGCF